VCDVVSVRDPYDRVLGFIDWMIVYIHHIILVPFVGENVPRNGKQQTRVSVDKFLYYITNLGVYDETSALLFSSTNCELY
jgi:hypothetical protein